MPPKWVFSPICDPLRFFFKNRALSLLYPYGALTSCKKFEKTNERSPRYLKTNGLTDRLSDRQGRLLWTPWGKLGSNNTPVTDPNLVTLTKSLSSAGSHIHGSPYQKSSNLRELLGLMIAYGTPALWIMLSPAVVHSPIFIQLSGETIDFINFSDIPSHTERAKLVANNPVAAALYCNTVMDAFTKYPLAYKQPKGGVFGLASTFHGMTEEQGTGKLHNHMLVWLHGFRSAFDIRLMLEDKTFLQDLIKYLEQIIKQGFLDTDNFDVDVNVSECSCKNPINPSDYDTEEAFSVALAYDVNRLVKSC